MLRTAAGILFALLLPLGTAPSPAVPAAEAPAYTPDHAMKFPADYRSWVFLVSVKYEIELFAVITAAV